ncbi:MAG: galactose mutarotase, partial [Rikenellaceae bacterium]|nr:galactose mutarotase [Rikenellaceae bacterium]
MMNKLKILALAAVLGMISCQSRVALPLLSASAFDTTVNGQTISLYTLTNASGSAVQITNYGGRVVSLWTPDREGNFRDVVLGFDNIADYLSSKSGNQGAVVGRYANRIEDRRFTLDSVEYLLAGNEAARIAPVGVADFNRAIFTPKPVTNARKEQSLELNYLSPDGEAGFPGNADVTVIYTLTNDNELKIEYIATTDRPTVLSLTNHSFFNLRGGEGDIYDYELYVNADSYLEIKEGTIPTGNIVTVEGTPLDFRTPIPI